MALAPQEKERIVDMAYVNNFASQLYFIVIFYTDEKDAISSKVGLFELYSLYPIYGHQL